jgi:putative transposase
MSFSTSRPGLSPCENVLAPFLCAEGLPFADVLTAADIEQAFAEEEVAFGAAATDFWTPALTLWTFLSQVLSGVKSCRPAVARAVVAMALTCAPKDIDTGNYCRARAKLPTTLLRRLTQQVGATLEQQAPAARLWHRQHVLLVDGFTTQAPDTADNQKAYPQPNTQKPGLGFPLIRVLVLLSLATAACQGLAIGPYQGKETAETALFRTLLDQLTPGTIILADRFFCSYFLLALLQARGVPAVVRLHQRRASDFRCGRRLGPDDHVVVWQKPKRPDWMDEATYAAMPATLTVREVRKQVSTPGFRVRQLDIITTLLNADEYTTEDIAELYHQRWHVELDIRAIKATMQMDELRCLTPFMIEKEIWTHFLGYNLIRKVAAQAAWERDVCARQISFAASQQVVLAGWSKLTEASAGERATLARRLLSTLTYELVGNRPNRIEPRAKKRRPKKMKLLTKPRVQAQAELRAGRREKKAA